MDIFGNRCPGCGVVWFHFGGCKNHFIVVEIIELIVGAVELGVVPFGIYFYKTIKKKLDTIPELEKDLQSKIDTIQDLQHKLGMKDLEIKMLKENKKNGNIRKTKQ